MLWEYLHSETTFLVNVNKFLLFSPYFYVLICLLFARLVNLTDRSVFGTRAWLVSFRQVDMEVCLYYHVHLAPGQAQR